MQEMIIMLPDFSPDQLCQMVPDDVQDTSAVHSHCSDGEPCHQAKNDIYSLMQDAKYLYDLMPDDAKLSSTMATQLTQCVQTLKDIRRSCEEQGCEEEESDFGHDFIEDDCNMETPFSRQFDI
jgi:hypothetical protein